MKYRFFFIIIFAIFRELFLLLLLLLLLLLFLRIFARFSCYFSTKRFKKLHSNMSYLNKLNKLIKSKSAQGEVSVWVYWTYKWICGLDINNNNDQECTEVEAAPLSSAAKLKQSTLNFPPLRHISTRNNEKYIGNWTMLSLVRIS